MATAITVAEQQQSDAKKVLLIESESSVGGRVRSDFTDDGFILDRGFAVFIEAYPQSQQMLDYDALRLNQFLPGARVKLRNNEKLAAVSDPLRRRRDIIKAITSPVGSLRDKANLLPLFFTVITKDIQSLFDDEDDTDTLSCLRSYNFSEEFISSFFAPFLEGIYLTPLSKQSSKMFYFVMKMFTVGSAALPMGGMQSVSDQLGQKAQDLGVEIKLNSRVLSIQQHLRQEEQQATSITANDNTFSVEVGNREQDEQQHINAKSVVVATDYNVARNLLQDIPGLESLKSLPKLSQRSVGCIYYAFQSPAPLEEPILLLNGEGHERILRPLNIHWSRMSMMFAVMILYLNTPFRNFASIFITEARFSCICVWRTNRLCAFVRSISSIKNHQCLLPPKRSLDNWIFNFSNHWLKKDILQILYIPNTFYGKLSCHQCREDKLFSTIS
eukprot:scaffold11456_cov163-Skeletonema_dohrnii-CCMP3373.AAC.1